MNALPVFSVVTEGLLAGVLTGLLAAVVLRVRPPRADATLRTGFRQALARFVGRWDCLVFHWPGLRAAFVLALCTMHVAAYIELARAVLEHPAGTSVDPIFLAHLDSVMNACLSVDALVAWLMVITAFVRARGWRVINRDDLDNLPVVVGVPGVGWADGFPDEASDRHNPSVGELPKSAQEAIAAWLVRHPAGFLTAGVLQACLAEALAPAPVRLWPCRGAATGGGRLVKRLRSLGTIWGRAKRVWHGAVRAAVADDWEESLGRYAHADRLTPARQAWNAARWAADFQQRLPMPAAPVLRARL